MRKRGVIPIAIAMLVSCSHVFAQRPAYSPEHREWEGGGFAGTSFSKGFQFPTTVNETGQQQTVGINFASGYQVGAQITQNLRDFWAASLEYSFANQPLRFTNLTPTIQSLSLSHGVHRWTYDISYLPLSPRSRFRPYAKAGVGTALFYISGDSKDEARALGVNLRDSWAFAFDVGGGLRYLIDDEVGATFAFKDQITDIPSYGLPRSASVVNGQYTPGISRNGFFHNWQISVGLEVQWDE